MKRSQNTLLSSLLLSALLVSVFSSCGGEAPVTDPAATQTPTQAAETEPVETEAVDFRTKFPHEDIDFGGKVFSVIGEQLLSNNLQYTDFDIEAENGDILNDAVFRRNSEVSERFNLQFSTRSENDACDVVGKAVKAGDSAYDAAAIRLCSAYTRTNYFVDLLSLDNLSLDASWWDQNSVRDLSIANVLYMVTGDIFYRHYYGAEVMLFNKKMVQDYDIENLYDCVNDGRWTIDKMGELCRLTTKDLDSNGKMDRYDQFGFATQNVDYVPALINACGMKAVSKDENDMPYFSVDIGRASTMLERYGSYYKDCVFEILRDANWEYLCAFWVFPEGRSLFYWAAVHYIPWQLRDIDFDYGILPFPKFDEEQDSYHATITSGHSYCYMIPKSAAAPEQSAYIMDALGFYGENLIKDVFYESCLKRKYSYDVESLEMLDLIFDNLVYDIGIYADFGGFINDFQTTFTLESAVNLASVYAKYESKIEKEIEKYVTQTLEDINS